MPRLLKALDEDKEFDEDFSFDFGFILELMASMSTRVEFVAADTSRRLEALDVEWLEARALRYTTRCEAREVPRAELLRERAALNCDFIAAVAEFRAIEHRENELSAMNERCRHYVEDALLEMVAIVRKRIDVLNARPDDGESLGFAAGALVLLERMLSVWLTKWAIDRDSVSQMLEVVTGSIDSFDTAALEACTGEGLAFRPLREMVNLDSAQPRVA